MDVSFSIPTWKLNQIKNIDRKLQEEFYSSTPYNLNDFKETLKQPQSIFKIVQGHILDKKNNTIKQLIKNQNLSLAIFTTFLYQYLFRNVNQEQHKNQLKQNKENNPNIKNQIQKNHNSKSNPDEEKQTQRGFIQMQRQQKAEDFQILKSLKLKIYQIDLCKLDEVPQKFIKYKNNNLLKKIIFQYLNKVLHNISLIQILLESNQVLKFALSLVSQSLLFKKGKITFYNQSIDFRQQVEVFLQHFQGLRPKPSIPDIKSAKLLSIDNIKRKDNQKVKSQQIFKGIQNFTEFIVTKSQMKSKYICLTQQNLNNQLKYFVYFYNQNSNKKPISNQIKSNKNIKTYQGSKKKVSSTKTIKIKSDTKLKQTPQTIGFCMKYFGCFLYFFSDSPKK